MEWVETTGKSLEEAKEAALDELGVDHDDAEFEIVEEPKAGLFGRVRGEARVRARVRPTAPRPKDGGRRRARRESGGAQADSNRPGTQEPAAGTDASESRPRSSRGGSRPRARQRSSSSESRSGRDRRTEPRRGEPVPVEALEQQGEVAVQFLEGLVEAFGFDATVGVRSVNDEAVEIAVTGDDLGLLVGPRGATLQAIQELTRTAVLRQTNIREGWVVVDVADYRQKRRGALEKFARQVAEQVTTTGTAVRLDPMPPADRKVVHDVLNTVDGVVTGSEGEEPRRRVVIRPDAG
ncbi:MAG TPA: RNA-binding cell elongation regulator Jag/EloR [Acidimicrobiales bacterium]|nr:RNA-binding cell elongation regulator Jag/EloR [Acidimicrobiales bacterium]